MLVHVGHTETSHASRVKGLERQQAPSMQQKVAEQKQSTNNSTPSPVAKRLGPDSSSESPAPSPTHEGDRGRQVSSTLSETTNARELERQVAEATGAAADAIRYRRALEEELTEVLAVIDTAFCLSYSFYWYMCQQFSCR